ncbi:hypothetical protein [Haliangium sp.]|uniref:hypothetical protein n=1 Tax=Haliangium sp. TaxID=2663208 RepID=UPI003D131D00
MFQYSIEHVDPATVHEDLLRMWSDNLPVESMAAEAKYQWTYVDAPRRPEGVFVLAVRDGDGESHPVGTAGLGTRTFYANGRPLEAGLLADLAVDKAHRTALPAIRLIREVRRRALSRFDLSYGYPNQSAEGVFLRCGYRKLGTMGRYAAVLRHAPFVRRVVDLPVLPRLAGAVLDGARLGQALPRSLHAAHGYRLLWLDQVDGRFDDLWLHAHNAYTLIGTRDAAFLRWRFLGHPTQRFRVAALVERTAHHTLHAYAVVERDDRAAYLRDLFGHPEALPPLLDLLLPALRLQRCSSVSFDFLGSRRVIGLLISRGFEFREPDRTIIADVGRSRGDLRSLLDDAESWHLTDADEDT